MSEIVGICVFALFIVGSILFKYFGAVVTATIFGTIIGVLFALLGNAISADSSVKKLVCWCAMFGTAGATLGFFSAYFLRLYTDFIFN